MRFGFSAFQHVAKAFPRLVGFTWAPAFAGETEGERTLLIDPSSLAPKSCPPVSFAVRQGFGDGVAMTTLSSIDD
jgi:hypothetical protein